MKCSRYSKSHSGTGDACAVAPKRGKKGFAAQALPRVGDSWDMVEILERRMLLSASPGVSTTPTTSGISDITVLEDASATTLNLWSAFADVEDSDPALQYTVTANSNPSLFGSAIINASTGTLRLVYASNATGSSNLAIRATDTLGNYVETSFGVTVEPVNDAPTLNVIPNQTHEANREIQTILLAGIASGPANEQQSLSFTGASSSPEVVSNPTVSWNSDGSATLTYSCLNVGTAVISVTLSDNGGTDNMGVDNIIRNFAVTVTAPPAAVTGRYLFYNKSAWDGATSQLPDGLNDDAAIATDKQALVAGTESKATYSNYSNYTRGINGVIIDVQHLPSSATAGNIGLTFQVGNSAATESWASAPNPTSILIRRGQGTAGADRVVITWADGLIKNQWLRTTMAASSSTGLRAPDIFYFGNQIAESGNTANNSISDTSVDAADVLTTQNNQKVLAVSVQNRFDYNRDKRVDAADILLAQNNQKVLGTLRLLTAANIAVAQAAGQTPYKRAFARGSATNRGSLSASSPGVFDAVVGTLNQWRKGMAVTGEDGGWSYRSENKQSYGSFNTTGSAVSTLGCVDFCFNAITTPSILAQGKSLSTFMALRTATGGGLNTVALGIAPSVADATSFTVKAQTYNRNAPVDAVVATLNVNEWNLIRVEYQQITTGLNINIYTASASSPVPVLALSLLGATQVQDYNLLNSIRVGSGLGDAGGGPNNRCWGGRWSAALYAEKAVGDAATLPADIVLPTNVATDYFCDPSIGSDNNDGSLEHPFKTDAALVDGWTNYGFLGSNAGPGTGDRLFIQGPEPLTRQWAITSRWKGGSLLRYDTPSVVTHDRAMNGEFIPYDPINYPNVWVAQGSDWEANQIMVEDGRWLARVTATGTLAPAVERRVPSSGSGTAYVSTAYPSAVAGVNTIAGAFFNDAANHRFLFSTLDGSDPNTNNLPYVRSVQIQAGGVDADHVIVTAADFTWDIDNAGYISSLPGDASPGQNLRHIYFSPVSGVNYCTTATGKFATAHTILIGSGPGAPTIVFDCRGSISEASPYVNAFGANNLVFYADGNYQTRLTIKNASSASNVGVVGSRTGRLAADWNTIYSHNNTTTSLPFGGGVVLEDVNLHGAKFNLDETLTGSINFIGCQDIGLYWSLNASTALSLDRCKNVVPYLVNPNYVTNTTIVNSIWRVTNKITSNAWWNVQGSLTVKGMTLDLRGNTSTAGNARAVFGRSGPLTASVSNLVMLSDPDKDFTLIDSATGQDALNMTGCEFMLGAAGKLLRNYNDGTATADRTFSQAVALGRAINSAQLTSFPSIDPATYLRLGQSVVTNNLGSLRDFSGSTLFSTRRTAGAYEWVDGSALP